MSLQMNESNNSEDLEEIEDLNNVDISQYPITTSAIIYPKMGVILQIILHSLSFLMPCAFILTFFQSAMGSNYFHWRILLFFIDIMAYWGLYLISSLLFGKLTLIVLKLFHEPRQGIFEASFKNRDYYFFCLRVSVKKFVFWIWNNFCFPWVTNFAFKVCEMRADFKSTLFDGWSDVEFMEFGENIMLGQGAVVSSSIIIGNHLLIKKVIIGDHVVLGGNCIVAPGTIIGKSTTLGVWAITHINQVLEPGWIYVGRPARKYQKAERSKEMSHKEPSRRIVDTGEKKIYKF
jgi:acetyltransferase-like isoleucine patch superfamily enzyme